MPMQDVVIRWDAWRRAIGPGQERLSPAGAPRLRLHMGVARSRLSSPHRHPITEPVLRHTALGQCSRDGLHATVCRHRFRSVWSLALASWSTGPRWASPKIFARSPGLYAEDRLTGGRRHAETDFRHEPERGRLHRRARRRPRLERAERRTVPVVV